jgi:hypothetical protein
MMQVHIMYLPLVFALGVTYEYWRRRRLLKKRMLQVREGLTQKYEEKLDDAR